MRYKINSPERQVALYDYLLSRGDKWTSMEEVTDSISMYPAFFTSYYHNSWARRLLTEDIKAINSSTSFNKVIVSGSNGIKLGKESEVMQFIRSELREIRRKLKMIWAIIRKCSRDQQITLEGEVVETFLVGKDAEQDD